ncbi:MAG TPA: D-glycero-beta-D-manno-heptose-7-phosphate kinase [Fibrobacteres bacterium]|nr:D-glycero-beta-D-manno-heptose-7-phosphate kinase [Fibrobacterota bacterium]
MEAKTDTISKDRLKKIVSGFKNSSIMVVGDCMIDKYIWGDVRRISPEAPVPVVQVESQTSRLGGAANVVRNLSSIGVTSYIVSICGNDGDGMQLREMLQTNGCRVEGLHSSKARPTTVKTRILAKHQQIVRVDNEITSDLDADEYKNIWKKVNELLPHVDGVIISDYAKGVISAPFIGNLVKKCKAMKKFVAVDPKERHFCFYKGISIMTPNLKEAHIALGIPYTNCTDDEIRSLGWNIINKYSLPYLLITLSERGMALFEREGKVFRQLPTVAQKVFDVTGAGDTVISVYSAAITSKANPFEAAFLANHAAGLTVAELGTAAVTPELLLNACMGTR